MSTEVNVNQNAKRLTSEFSRSFLSQVRHGKKKPSKRLLAIINAPDYIALFIASRRAKGCTDKIITYYQERLRQYTAHNPILGQSRADLERYLNTIPPCRHGLHTRYSSYRALKCFYRWLEEEYHEPNPMAHINAPILGKPILPILTKEQVNTLIEACTSVRDKAIISLLAESGLRLSEIAQLTPAHIDLEAQSVRILGKGRKESYAPFGQQTSQLLQKVLQDCPKNPNIWGLHKWGIVSLLRNLRRKTGLPCNPHTFRRTFACLLRKKGVDSLTIQTLGRWESLEMVNHYCRAFQFRDAIKHYQAPLG